MNLWGPLKKLQKRCSSLYLLLAQRFSTNSLIRDSWATMAQDLDQQAASLRALRPSFWKQLKKQEKGLLTAIKQVSSQFEKDRLDHPSEWSLHDCLARTLDFEEPIILQIYAPLIYRLRTQWTERDLGFYVLVNAHVTRLTRLVQPFSGDPTLTQRSIDLLLRFEREVQRPQPEPAAKKKKAKKKARRSRQPARPALKRARKAAVRLRMLAKRPRPLVKRAKVLAKRSKPLVKNIKLARRRARR